MQPRVAKKADPGEVLAKATARASDLLGLSGAALSRVLGVSEATVSRVLKGEKPIKDALNNSFPGVLRLGYFSDGANLS